MAAEGMTPEQEMMMKALFESFAKLRGETDSTTKKIKEIGDAGLTAAELDIELRKLSTDLKQKTKPEFGSFFKELATGKSTFKSMQGDIDRLSEAAKHAANEFDKAALETQRDALQEQEARNQARAAVNTGAVEMSKTLASGATKAVGGLVKGLQANASGTELASGLMNASIDVAAGAGKALGNTVSGVGGAMSSLPGKAKYVGMGLQVLGTVVGSASEAMGKLAKFGVEVLSKEVEKTVKAFNDMSASGAIFANGMQGMRDASAGAGLTVDQFAKVVTANSEHIGAAGLGVAEGAKQIGRVGKELQKSGVQNQLLKLGYSFEEQAALTAETMANMRKAGGGKLDDKEVAAQTQKYAENLRLISSITGEDAKKKMAAIQQENAELAFQQKVAGMSKEQRAQLNAAMATMTDQERKNFRDRMVFGEVINKEGAIYEATIDGARAKGEAAMKLAEEGNLTAASNSDLNAQYGEQIKQSILGQQALGVAAYAGAESVKGAAQAMAQALDQANTYTAEGVENAKKNNEAAKNTTDALTNSVISAEQAAQSMKIKLQEMMDVPIAKFAEVSKQMLQAVADQLKELGLTKGGKPGEKEGPSTWDKLKSAGQSALMGAGTGAVTGGLYGGATGALAGGVGAVPGAIAGATTGAIGGAIMGAIEGWFNAKSGKAIGGIASGPKSGYLEKLHGDEAVIPTVGGRVPLDVTQPTLDPVALAEAQKNTITQTLNSGFGSMGTDMSTNLSKSFEMVKPTAGGSGMDVSSSVSDMLNMVSMNSKNIEQMSAGMRQPINFEATDFGSKLFDDFQVGSKLTTSTMLADLDKTRSLNQSNFDEQFAQTRSLFGQQLDNTNKLANVQLDGLSKQNQARMESLQVERLARKSMTDEQFADWKRKSTEKAGAAKGKTTDKKKDEPNFLEKMGLNSGTAVGAAIGTMLLPGLGTILGGGIGTLVDNITANDNKSKGVLGGLVDSAKAGTDKGKSSDKKKDEPNFLERMGLNTGTAVGAAIGTVLLPGLGTVLGGGIGTLVDNVTAKDDKSKGVLGGLVDSAKNFFNVGNNQPVTGKQTETYTINGKPASKEQFDKYMKDNPELAQLMGKAQGLNKDNNTKDPVSGAMDSIKNAFSDKGIIGDFANKNKEMLAGAGAGLMVGGPMGAVVGGLAGQVAAMTDSLKPKTAKEEVKPEDTKVVKQDKPRAEASPEMKTLTDSMTQLVMISQKQIEQQREMIDTMGRQKDIAERHYQSSL
jgi:hypothetical protein